MTDIAAQLQAVATGNAGDHPSQRKNDASVDQPCVFLHAQILTQSTVVTHFEKVDHAPGPKFSADHPVGPQKEKN